LDVDVNIDKTLFIKFDINHFKQIVLNILLNSKDALKDTLNPIIVIEAKEGKKDIELYFKDNGCGMNKEKLQYIFEPFYTTKSTGNGVGMFVVKQMVEDNGGRICADSDGDMKGMCIMIAAEKGDINEK
jgi:signal transduction histidine kinase